MANHLPMTMPAPTTTTTETASTPTTAASVPPPRPLTRAGRYWIALGIALAVLGVAVGASLLVDTPYATLSPGSARDTAPLVSVDGTETYAPAGKLFFLTVGIDGDVSVLEAATGWVDPDVDVLSREEVFGEGVTEEQNREINAAAMVGSKQTAVVVALTRLGIPLDPTGTGAVVIRTVEGTPAAEVLDAGDTIVAVDGRSIELYEDLAPSLSARAPGEQVTLTVEAPDGAKREVVVSLAARPDDADAGFLGIEGDTRGFDPGVPFAVDIDSARVGGPSAGLAFTLALLDLLTEGELTGGHAVAVTGTIDEAGRVGAVGGVAQKAAAAAAAGSEVMLVPSGTYEEATERDHGIEIIAVDTLDDALAALEQLGGDPLPPAPTPVA